MGVAFCQSPPLAEDFAEQLAVAPPFCPTQLQFHGPEPLTEEAVPLLHRLDVGVEVNVAPLLLPQAPFTRSLAEQTAVVPPFCPPQVQFQGPAPATEEGVPLLQRFAVGSVGNACPFEEPHTPFTRTLAEQFAVLPPFDPSQVQLYVPAEVETDEALPSVQRLDEGAVRNERPFAEPHVPSTWIGAAQSELVPPFCPSQVQVHAMAAPTTTEAVPSSQRSDVGAVGEGCPLAPPHVPSTSSRAEQSTGGPSCCPVQVQFHGPAPTTVEAVPAAQRLVVGSVVNAFPLDVPHAGTTSIQAAQFAAMPAVFPAAQVHVHCCPPVPETVEAVPTVQRAAAGGAVVYGFASAGPHWPLMGCR